MSLLSIFKFPTANQEDANVRAILIDGEPWFVAIDVCRALGLQVGNSGVFPYTRRLEAQELTVVKRTSPSTHALFMGGTAGSLTLITESGLYKLVMRSNKPEAVVFQNWVTSEVLPSIRKEGSYSLADNGRTEMPLPADINDALVRVLSGLEKVLAALTVQLNVPAKVEPDQILTARQIKAMGIGTEHTVSEIGYILTQYSATMGFPVSATKSAHPYGKVNLYSLNAARQCFASR